jgi:tetratricopeptide (TPR) repeat protein
MIGKIIRRSLKLTIIAVLVGLLGFADIVWAANRPPAEETILQGNRLCEQGRYREAAEVYRRALADYNSPDAAYNLGVTYEVNLRDMKQAVIYYQKFLDLEPVSDDARQVKGWIEDIKAAYTQINFQQADSPDKLPPQLQNRVIGDLKRAQDFFREGEYKAAEEVYLEVLQLYDSADACYNLGLIYDKKLNQKQQAIEYYQRFLVLDPASPDAGQVRQWIQQARKVIEEQNNLHKTTGSEQ